MCVKTVKKFRIFPYRFYKKIWSQWQQNDVIVSDYLERNVQAVTLYYIGLFKSSVQSIREHLQSQVQKLWSSKINPIRHQPPRIMVNPDPEAETYLKGIAENQPSEMDDWQNECTNYNV